MPPGDLVGLRETFEAIDKNHSGSISLEELTSHLQVKTVANTTRDTPPPLVLRRTLKTADIERTKY